VAEVWGGRCAFSGEPIGGGGPALTLTRWDRSRAAAVDNLILLTKRLAEAHDTAAQPFEVLEPSLVRAVEEALRQAGRERSAWCCEGGAPTL
jgi:hypothetical protein